MSENASKSTSLSMRLAIKSIKTKFPKVENISTADLDSRITEVHTIQATINSASTSDSRSTQHQPKGTLIILDCRPEEEYSVSHIQNAHRVDPDACVEDLNRTISLLQKQGTENAGGEQTVVCYCSVGYRSSQYVDCLRKQLDKDVADLGKLVQVWNLEGSLFQWANETRPMVDNNDRPTKYAHPFNFLFGKLLSKDLRKNHPES